MKYLNVVLYYASAGALGVLLARMGYPFTKWEYWAVMTLLFTMIFTFRGWDE